jgi:Protein of unknown function (DUF3455)
MFKRLLLSMLLIELATSALAQQTARPNVPDAIKAPAGERVILVAHATGSQIYACQPAADGKFAWALKAPDAQLHDQMGAIIGYHSAGPTWKLDDGSGIKGKAVAKVDQPDAIPWLLVQVVEHTGAGKLSRVTSIQRINTKDGVAPASGCDASTQGQETKSSYTADYYFYGPK